MRALPLDRCVRISDLGAPLHDWSPSPAGMASLPTHWRCSRPWCDAGNATRSLRAFAGRSSDPIARARSARHSPGRFIHALPCEGCVPADGRQGPEADHEGAGHGMGQAPAPLQPVDAALAAATAPVAQLDQQPHWFPPGVSRGRPASIARMIVSSTGSPRCRAASDSRRSPRDGSGANWAPKIQRHPAPIAAMRATLAPSE